MRLLVLFLSVAVFSCSALVIPDQEALAEDFCIAGEPDHFEQTQHATDRGNGEVESWWEMITTMATRRHGPAAGLALSLLGFLTGSDRLVHNAVYAHGDDLYPPASYSRPCPPHICPASNYTLWQLVSQSARTARIAELLSYDRKLVALLNSSHANHTLFAPTNRALEDFLDENPPPSSWSEVLAYHIVRGAFPVKLLKQQQTLATELNHTGPGGPAPQRLAVTVDEDEVYLNGISRVIQEDNEIASPPPPHHPNSNQALTHQPHQITSNGVLQQIDHVLLPPPTTRTLLNTLPSRFSTFALALSHTNLARHLHPDNRRGGTTLALTNAAFDRLGSRVNAYLFSPQGEQCLRILMQYHLVLNRTLYSDALYDAQGRIEEFAGDGEPVAVHVELPTLLDGRRVNVDIARRKAGTVFRLNGFHRVRELDVLASDGVVHVLDRVLVPPKTLASRSASSFHSTGGDGEMTLEELQERLGGCGKGARMEL